MTEDVLERFLFLEDDLSNLRLTVHQDREYRIAALEKQDAMLRYALNSAFQLLNDAGLLE